MGFSAEAMGFSAAASSSSSAAPRLEISSENERRLRCLLLNSSTTTAPSPAPVDAPVARSESREQKGRRLRGVYDKLALESFSPAQIEQALSAIPDTSTFESALDWLCFNLPGDELPLKFASATASSSRAGTEGSVKVVSAAKDNWVPQSREPVEEKDTTKGVEIKIVRRQEEDVTLDDGPSSQAAWIRQYMEQQEEVAQVQRTVDFFLHSACVMTGFHFLRYHNQCSQTSTFNHTNQEAG